MRVPLEGWLLTGIIALGSTAALAADTKTPFPPCTTAPTNADQKAAKGAFEAGQGSFNEADYATAITYWRDAYRRDCTAHALLLNLARAYELKSDRSEAVNALETYLQRKPDTPDADQIRRRIDNLKSQMAASAPPPAPTAGPAPTATATTTATAFVPPPPAEHGTTGGRSLVPLFVAGGGGVLAILGGVMYASGKSKVDDFDTQCPNRKCPVGQENLIQEGNDARNQQNLGGVLFAVGAAGVAVGLIWYFTTPSGSQAGLPVQRASLTPVVGSGFGGVSLAGHF
jgi:tetratricopeptide (TPR) repeat protein